MTTKWGSLAELQETLWYYSQPRREGQGSMAWFAQNCAHAHPTLCHFGPKGNCGRYICETAVGRFDAVEWCWMYVEGLFPATMHSVTLYRHLQVIITSISSGSTWVFWISRHFLIIYYLSDTPQCIRHGTYAVAIAHLLEVGSWSEIWRHRLRIGEWLCRNHQKDIENMVCS